MLADNSAPDAPEAIRAYGGKVDARGLGTKLFGVDHLRDLSRGLAGSSTPLRSKRQAGQNGSQGFGKAFRWWRPE